jgi:serine/threonine protein phosphatase PrpC
VGQRGRIKFQTIAHSPTGFAVEAGFLGESEALFHAERHVVSNFIGNNEMRIEVGAPVALAKCDTLLIASDGLTDNVRIDEIVEKIRKGPIGDALDQLAQVARARMLGVDSRQPSKPDDLTVLLMRRHRESPNRILPSPDPA